jgi:hypothetical protein
MGYVMRTRFYPRYVRLRYPAVFLTVAFRTNLRLTRNASQEDALKKHASTVASTRIWFPALAASIAFAALSALVIGFAPGGGTDTTARVLSSKLTASFGQQVIVDNRPGHSGTIAVDQGVPVQPGT